MFVKICGINSEEAAEAAVAAGADAIGFVFAEESPRHVTPERARELCAAVPERMVRVAVMRHPPADVVRRVLDVFEPDWLQTDAEDFAGIELAPRFAALPVYRSNAVLPSRPPPRLLFEG